MHIIIKYTVIFGYTANTLIKIDGKNLYFPQKNIIWTKHLTYPIAVGPFIVQEPGLWSDAPSKFDNIGINISMVCNFYTN